MVHERPLVVVTDEALLDDVLRLAAAVGCELQRAPDIASARADWSRAPLIVVDEESLDDGLTPRAGLLLVTRGVPDAVVWQRAFDAGIEKVVSLPDREADLVAVLADVAEGPGEPGGCVIGVIGGRGGAGASVFAAALALTATTQTPAAAGAGALLLDCDPMGGGVDMTLGAETASGVRWPALRLDGGRISMPTLREALPEHPHRGRGLPFLSCDDTGAGPTRTAVASVVDAGRRAGAAVVCDLPRHLGPAADAVFSRADLIVMVVPAEVRACVSARRVAAQIDGTPSRAPVDAALKAAAASPDATPLSLENVEALKSLLVAGPLLSLSTPGTRRRPARRSGVDLDQQDAESQPGADRLPARTPDQQASTVAPRPAGYPAPLRTVTNAGRSRSPAQSYADRLCLVVRGPAPTGLSPQDIARAVQVPLLTSMAPDHKLAKALDRGESLLRPRSPLVAAARLTLAAARAEASRSEVAA